MSRRASGAAALSLPPRRIRDRDVWDTRSAIAGPGPTVKRGGRVRGGRRSEVGCGVVVHDPRDLRAPPALAPGALVAVVAPASPFDREELLRGLAWLRTRYRLKVASSILSRTGYLAGDDDRRAAELASAFVDPEVSAVVFARGGYGTMRIVDRVPWSALDARPKWLVGFSDATALHVVANARGVATVHAPNVTGLGRSITPAERAALLACLERPDQRAAWRGLEVFRRGSASGPMIGGNLALVAAMAAAGRLVVPEGAILALEDVTERPYRIDRMLTSLRLGGHLARASGIVFGGFTQCDPGPDGVLASEVLRERTRDLGVPVVAGAPFGHGAPNQAFILGGCATIDDDVVSFDRLSN
ncbi:MAG: LD-carboxypeptidase [Labilithrix sp.]|nr:LD-carboxypeptidase [Labilithrix sp.]